MEGRNYGVANGVVLQSTLFYQFAGTGFCGIAEDAAARGLIVGLRFYPSVDELALFFQGKIVEGEDEGGVNDGTFHLVEGAVSVAEMHFVLGKGFDESVDVYEGHPFKVGGGLLAVSAGVHIDGAAHTSGYSGGKFKAAKIGFSCFNAEVGEAESCADIHFVVFDDAVVYFIVDHQSIKTLVAKEAVGPFAEYVKGVVFLFGPKNGLLHFKRRMDSGKKSRRAANFEGGVVF